MQRRDCLRALGALGLLVSFPILGGGQGVHTVNHVRDLRRGRWLSSDDLLARLTQASSVIIGERHDNPEHHRLERWLIARLSEREALGGVALEMLDSEQQAILRGIPGVLLAELPDNELQALLNWQGGWEWPAYGPTLRQVLRLGIPVQAANLPGPELRKIAKASQAPKIAQRVVRAQRAAIVQGHCGLLPESMIDGMLAAQIARDRAMADALTALPATSVLICGSGHARRDIGAALHANTPPLCLGLVELAPGQDWTSALPASIDDGPPFDIVWFTPAVGKRGDVCAALRERFAH